MIHFVTRCASDPKAMTLARLPNVSGEGKKESKTEDERSDNSDAMPERGGISPTQAAKPRREGFRRDAENGVVYGSPQRR